MVKWISELHTLLYKDIIRRQMVTPFIIFAAFLITFGVARLIVYLLPGFNIANYFSGTYHIHHFFFGIGLVILSNWVTLVSDSQSLRRISAGVFGVGLGLIADELGLFLVCGTTGLACEPSVLYWERMNYDIVTFVVLVFLVILYFEPVWFHFHTNIRAMWDRMKGLINRP